MKAQIQEITLPTPNGQNISVVKFFSENKSNQAIIISSATGVLQKYYEKFATYCAINGFTVYTFDYAGIGKSIKNLKALKEYNNNLSSWGRNDQAAIVALAKSENKESQITLVTHSIGGQILGFNPNSNLIDKVIFVASQGGYWKDFNGIHILKMWLFWHLIIPILTPIFGYFPSKKFKLFENLPKNMVYEWASWGRRKEYMMHYKNETDYYFDALKASILALSFAGDHFAPAKTVDWLANQFKNAKVERVHHHKTEQERAVKHFGFFKLRYKELFWDNTIQWILTNKYQ